MKFENTEVSRNQFQETEGVEGVLLFLGIDGRYHVTESIYTAM